MLRQKGESVEEIKKGGRLLLGDYFGELVSSLSTRPGEFSEVFIYNSERGMGLGRLVVDPFSYWTYTTNPDDVSLLNGFYLGGSPSARDHRAVRRGLAGEEMRKIRVSVLLAVFLVPLALATFSCAPERREEKVIFIDLETVISEEKKRIFSRVLRGEPFWF